MHGREAQQERILGDRVEAQASRPALSNGAEDTRKALLDGLVAFAEQMSKGGPDEPWSVWVYMYFATCTMYLK